MNWATMSMIVAWFFYWLTVSVDAINEFQMPMFIVVHIYMAASFMIDELKRKS